MSDNDAFDIEITYSEPVALCPRCRWPMPADDTLRNALEQIAAKDVPEAKAWRHLFWESCDIARAALAAKEEPVDDVSISDPDCPCGERLTYDCDCSPEHVDRLAAAKEADHDPA